MKVRVYWNLHKKCFSVQDCKTNKVIDHRFALTLSDAQFVVRNGGRQRVLREGRKNVHAFVTGYINTTGATAHALDGGQKITYNPYKYDSFVTADDEMAVTDAQLVTLSQWKQIPSIWARNPNRPTLDTLNQQ